MHHLIIVIDPLAKAIKSFPLDIDLVMLYLISKIDLQPFECVNLNAPFRLFSGVKVPLVVAVLAVARVVLGALAPPPRPRLHSQAQQTIMHSKYHAS